MCKSTAHVINEFITSQKRIMRSEMGIIDKIFGNKCPEKVAESEKLFENYTLFWTIFTSDMTLPIPSKSAHFSYPVPSEQHIPVWHPSNTSQTPKVLSSYDVVLLKLS